MQKVFFSRGNMKKKFILILLILMTSFTAFVRIFQANIFLVRAEENLSDFASYEREVEKINDTTSYEIISICKSSLKLEDAISVVDNNNEIVINYDYEWLVDEINNLGFENLNKNNLEEICKKYDFLVSDSNNFYKVYSKFCLKHLIVKGNLNGNYYGASQVATGYKNYNLLAYTTEGQTKSAYNELINQPNLTVQIDKLFIAEDCEMAEVSSTSFSSGTYNSWGANAIEINEYKEYLGDIPADREVVVAVIDTGINTNHQMFQDRFLYDSYGNILGKSYYTSQYTYSGYSFEDDQGHGTHVAGIICDLTPSNVKILPIKALKYDKNGSYNNILLAIQCVYEEFLGKGLNIVCVNMSFGGNAGSDTDLIDAFVPLFNEYRENKILPIVASGNEKTDTSTQFPAGCDNAVVVSALKQSGSSYVADTSYTNYGKTVDISAPGTAISSCAIESSNSTALSILNGGSQSTKLCYMSGTSMATPHVSAVACLLYLDNIYYNQSGESSYTAELIEARLMKMAEKKMSKDGKIDPSKSNWAYYYGVGMLNMKYYQDNDIKYTVKPATYTYDGKYHNISVNLTQTYTNAQIFYGFGADSCTITDITTNDNFKNATGDSGIDIYFKITADGYDSVVGKSKLIIYKRTAIIEVQNQTGIYGNTPNVISNSGISFKSGLVTGDTVNVQLTTNATKTRPIGKYKMYASTTNQNYKLEINYTTTSGYYVIIPRPVIIEMQNDESIYGDTIVFSNKYSVSSSSPNEVLERDDLGIKAKCSVTSSTSVGEYSLDATCSNENYSVTVIKGVFTIKPKPVTISLQNQDGVYGETPNLNQTKYSLNEDMDASSLGTITISTNATSKSSVGSYALFVKFSNNNYTASISSTAYYVISARTLNINAENQSGIYGETPSLDNSKYSVISGLVNGDNVEVLLYTSATKKSSVGAYPISATTTNLNYIINVQNGQYNVTPRPLTIQLDNFEDEYGNNRNLPCLFIITTGSLAEGDDNSDLKITTSNNASKTSPVGEYVISGSYSNSNYNVTIRNAKLTIKPRTLNIELQNQYGVYGEAVNLNQTEYSATNFIEGDDIGVHLSVDASSLSIIGAYPISVAVDNANYNPVIINDGYYIIGKRPISIKINNQYGVYGETPTLNNKYTLESGSVVNGDILNIFTITDATSSSMVGEYDIRAKTSNANYDIAVSLGKYIIQARQITINLQNQSGEYGYAPTLLTNKYDILAGSIVNEDNLNLTLSTTATAKSSVGLYSLSLDKYNNNYAITSNVAQFEVLPRNISLQPKNVTGVYGNQPVLNGYTTSKQIISGDDLNIQLSTTATNKSVVGNYDILITASHPNYSISCLKGIYTITQRQLQISAQNQSGIYGETPSLDNSKYSLTNGTIVNDDIVNIYLSTDATSISPVGSNYTLTASTDNENYTILTISGKYIINQREIELELESQNGQYGNTPALDNSKYTIIGGTLIGEDDLNITLSTTATYKSNANTYYDIKAYCGNNNYKLNYQYSKYLVLPRTITIKLTEQSGFYGNAPVLNNLQFTVESGSIVNNDNLNLQLSTTATNLSEVGSYIITVQSCGNYNYNVSSVNGVFKVLARKITISVHQQFVIGENVILDFNDYSIISGSIINNDDLNLSMTTSATSSVKGNYDIQVVCNNKNYELIVQEAICEIIAKSVVIKKVASSYYGEDIYISTDFEIVSGKIIEGEDLGILFSTNATKQSPAGDYNITETHTNTNYEVILQACVYKILPRIITVNVDNQQGEYGSTPKLNSTYTIIDGTIINDDVVNITLSTSASSRSSVGEYDIIAKSSNKNYQIKVSSGKYIVTPRLITVKLTNQSGIYGSDVVLNNSKYVVTSGSVFVSDNLNITLTTSATANSEVGEYDIYLNYENKNYSITSINGKYIISPKNIIITVNLTGVYGDNVEINKNQVLVESDDLINSDKLNLYVTTTATNLSPVGKYDLQVVSNNKNYTVTLQNSKFEITPRPIEIKLNNQSGIYGDVINLSNTDYYVLTGDIIGEDDLKLQTKTLATSISPVGEYELYAVYSNNNYTITINKGVYTITPRQITIKIANSTAIYGEDIDVTHSTYSIVEGKLISGDKLNLQYKTTATNLSSIGKYDITADCLNLNYTVTIQVGELEITKRQVSLNIIASSQYGEEINLTDYTYEEIFGKIVNNDDLMIVLQTSAQKTDNVGEYDLSVSVGNSNYLFTVLKAIYKIVPRQLSVTLLPQSSVYGDEIALNQEGYTINSGSILEGDSVEITLSTVAEQFKSAGEYDIFAECKNKNYALNFENAKYSILPRDISISVVYTVEYGYNLQFNNVEFVLINGRIINDDKLNVKVSYSTENSLAIGDFDVNLVSANPNYNITLQDSVLHIIPRKIGIKINQSSMYGDMVILNQNDYILTKDLYGNDSLNLQLNTSATNISPVGKYDIEIVNNNPNYQMEILENTLTITPREIMLDITDASSVYGEEINLSSVSFSLIKGSVVNNDDLQIEFTTNATNTSDAGTYLIDAKSNNNNYNLTNVTGTYTINKRKLTIKLNNQSTYRGVMFKIKQGKYEIVEGDIVEGDDLKIRQKSKAKMFYFAGDYSLYGVCGNDNYEVEFISAELKLKVSFFDYIFAIALVVGLIYLIIFIVKTKNRKKKAKQELAKWDDVINW